MKEFNLKSLVRNNILNITSYSSARDEFSGKADVFLDANENSYCPDVIKDINRYPDPHQKNLKEAISLSTRIKSDNIFLGNGSDEIIDLLFRVFCEPNTDSVVLMPPTYGMYKVSADINEIKTINVILNPDFSINVEEVLRVVSEHNIKMIFICSPNNPTGNCFSSNSIKIILDSFKGIVIIDEAYQDFSNKESWNKNLSEYPNLVVIQTFSKAWGLAGVRLGIGFAGKEIIRILNNIKPPYNINSITQEIGIKAINNISAKKQTVDKILKSREYLASELHKLKCITR